MENYIIEETTNTGLNEIVESTSQELKILITEEDKYGNDITKMSNFFDIYLKQLSYELSTNSTVNILENIPFADISIINDIFNHVEVVMKGKYGYVPDFDSLPNDVLTKLKKGIYKIGESKQVDGNMRAVILDENNVRIKDITLKRVADNPNIMETSRSIANQVQMKQIYAKLDDIQKMQSYQIDRDRDRDIVVPFLNARSYILQAQIKETPDEVCENLLKATDELTRAINAVYTDISTTSQHLVKATNRPIFRRISQIESFIGYLTNDLQLAAKYVGLQMQLFDYLGNKASSTLVFEGYKHIMRDFITKSINRKAQSIATLIHLNYPYNEKNRNWWYNFAKDMTSALQTDQCFIEEKEILLVSTEG
ncbi:MAG: hypothetical protein LBD23_19540 [Oscillospiraceae bacterium]|jgi:hypothetical protein|nr:hypothetical protein [Oscillospiraceae bacterium]